MFKDQFGNVLTIGDVVVYAKGYSTKVATIAKITKMVLREDSRWERSYMSVRPLEKQYQYATKTYKTGLGYARGLQRPERVIKVDPALLEQALTKTF